MAPGALGLLAPYLLGAWLNSRLWTRKLPAAEPVLPGLLLGRLPSRRDLDRLGVAAIIDLSAELPCPTGGRPYRNVAMLDLVPPDPGQLDEAVVAIQSTLATVRGPVLVNCALGFSRSALALAAWLLASGRAATAEAAVGMIHAARPAIVLGPAKLAALQSWWMSQARPDSVP